MREREGAGSKRERERGNKMSGNEKGYEEK